MPDQEWRNTTAPAEFQEQAIPKIRTEDVPSCPVCNSSDFECYAIGFDYEIMTCSNPWRFVQCKECHHIWLNPRPAIDALSTIYPSTYYAYNYAEVVNPIAIKGKEMLDGLKMRSILRYLEQQPRSYLDVGCGNGRFLRYMERQGISRENNYGLELDEGIVSKLAAQGYRVYCERVEDSSQIPTKSLDLITMFHVIEHVDNPGTVVEKVVEWLAPGGVFAIETPNINSLDARLFKNHYWGGYHIPRHWNLFTPDTLERLLHAHGLEVVNLQYQTGHSFWMYSVHHWLRYEHNRRKLAKYFDPMGALFFLMLFTAFDKFRSTLKARTSSMLMLAQKRK